MPRKPKVIYPEEELVSLIRARDPKGAEALYTMYSATLYGFVSRIVPDTAEAEDVLQESLIKIWLQFDSYDSSRGRLFTWMVNIARHLAIDHVRSRSFHYRQNYEALDNHTESFLVDEQGGARTDFGLLKYGASTLPEKERCIFNLVYYSGYTHPEVAESLCLPLGTVKTRLLRAVKRLRAVYVDESLAVAS